MVQLSSRQFKTWVVLLILVGPFLDMLTGYLQHSRAILEAQQGGSVVLSPGVIYRGFLLIPIMALMTLKRRTNLQLLEVDPKNWTFV